MTSDLYIFRHAFDHLDVQFAQGHSGSRAPGDNVGLFTVLLPLQGVCALDRETGSR